MAYQIIMGKVVSAGIAMVGGLAIAATCKLDGGKTVFFVNPSSQLFDLISKLVAGDEVVAQVGPENVAIGHTPTGDTITTRHQEVLNIMVLVKPKEEEGGDR